MKHGSKILRYIRMELSGLDEIVIASVGCDPAVARSESARRSAPAEIEMTTQTLGPEMGELQHTTGSAHQKSSLRLWVWSHVCASLLCLACAGATVAVHFLARDKVLARIPVWRYLLLSSTIIPCHYASALVVYTLSHLIETRYTFTHTLLYFWIDLSLPLRRLLRAVLYCVMFAVCLTSIGGVYSPVYDYGLRALCCLVIYSAVNFFRTMGGKLLALRYHSGQHFDLVASALRKEYLLRQLCKQQQNKKVAAETLDKKVAIKMHELEKHIKKGELDATIAERISAGTTNTETDAKHTGLYIFWNMCVRADREYLIQEDLRQHVPASEVDEAFAMLDLNGNGRVTLEEIVGAVQHIYDDREKLSDMLKDANDIVVHLKDIIGAILHTMCLFVYCVVFKMDVSKVYVSFSSLVVVWSLVFAASIRNVYESVVFLFGVHPFDVGDILVVADETVIVQKMGLNTCIFRKPDNSLMWYPNSKLSNYAIVNVSRSGCRRDVLTLDVDNHITQAHLDTVRHACLHYMSLHPKDYKQTCQCQITTVKDADNLLLTVQWETMFGQADVSRVARVRHGLYMIVASQLARLDIGAKAPKKGQGGVGDRDDGEDSPETSSEIDCGS